MNKIFLDLDGLLIESESVYADGIQKVLDRFGKKYTDDIRVKVIGK